MNGINFGQRRSEVQMLLNDWQARVAGVNSEPELEDRFREVASRASEVLNSEAKLRVSLLGEFSAGKSSLIAALTGTSVDIGADVTTQETTAYEWKGVTLVDTPGVQAETSETDHDEIARESTVDADLILFVLTNELFNQRLADYYHFVAGEDGLGLADKMLVIVNKMDRESNPDDVIVSEVEKAIAPHRSRVHLAAIENFIKAQTRDDDLRKRLLDRSRVEELVTAIDEFIEERGALGRLTRPLQLFEESLEDLRAVLLGDDEGAQSQLELIRRQKRAVDEGERSLNSLEIRWATELRHIVLSRTTETLESVPHVKSAEELEEVYQNAFEAIEPELDTHFVTITSDLQQWVDELQEKLEEIDASSLGDTVRALRAASAGAGEFQDTPGGGFDFAKMVKVILDEGVGKLLEGAAKDPKAVKNFVYEVGKKIGKKWKPWEATKLGKRIAEWAGKGGKALGPLMVALDFYMEYRNEKALEEKQRHLAKTRLSMQRQFRALADAQVEALREALSDIRVKTTHKMIHRLEEQATAVAADEAQEEALAALAGDFIKRSRTLRNQISAVGS